MNDIPDATTPNPDHDDDTADVGDMIDTLPDLTVCEPFAIAENLVLLQAAEKPIQHPGCVAIVQCEGSEQPCGQVFRINLLDGAVKHCPRCNRRYAHALVIGPIDDNEIVPAALAVIFRMNGYEVPDDELEPDGGDLISEEP